jgi:hypothetical protein
MEELLPEGIRDCNPELYDAIMERGQVFALTETDLPAGEGGQCFANSLKVAVKHRLLYAEGYRKDTDELGEVWRQHGWNADEDGNAIDVTSPDGSTYIGVTFSPREAARAARAMVERGYLGRLFEPPAKRPYLKGTDPKVTRRAGVVYRPGRMTQIIDPDEEG